MVSNNMPLKRSYLKRGTSQLKRTGFKAQTLKPKKNAVKGQNKLPRATLKSISTLRNSCDKLLTPIVKKLYPRCLLCGGETQVAHHHVHKSKSSRLRYELSNLINLCNSCHLALHMNESYHASRIVSIKGLKWFTDLDKMKDEIVKTNREWYQTNLERLKSILNS